MPPPYMITPPYRDNGRYEAGEHLSFSLTLMGNATILYPYVVRAFQEMENSTIGHPLAELGGRRGKIALHTIHAIHPITQEKQLLWERGTKKQPATPRHLIQAADITTRADQFPTDHLTINFLSPTRIIANERVQRHVTFPILIARLAQRLEQIQHEYSNDPLIEETTRGKEWYLSLKEQAAGVQVERDETRWIEVFSHSSRKKQSMSIGGIVGKVAFKGNIAPLRELLAWGELLRVGKNVAKGGGRYLIEW